MAGTRRNSVDRRKLKRWLLTLKGDGETVPCEFCGKRLTIETMTLDHITPGAYGGNYNRQNVRPACQPCNLRRGAPDPHEFWRFDTEATP